MGGWTGSGKDGINWDGTLTASKLGGDGSGLTNLPIPTISLTTGVSGILPIANGGTNKTTWTSGGLVYATGTNVLGQTANLNLSSTTLNVPGSVLILGQSYTMGMVPAGGFAVELGLNSTNTGSRNTAAHGVDFYVDSRASGGPFSDGYGVFTVYHQTTGTSTQTFPLSLSVKDTVNIGSHSQNGRNAQLYVKGMAIVANLPTLRLDAITSQSADLFQMCNVSGTTLTTFSATGTLNKFAGIADAVNITVGTTTGTKIGTATTEKLAFFNSTPIVQPANTVAIDTLISNLGLRATGGTANFALKVTHSLPENLKAYTVATLPAGAVGDLAYVTDALAPAYLGVIVGGGAIVTPVFFDGANWIAH